MSAHFEVEGVAASRELGVPVVYYYAGAMDPRRLARARFGRMVAISNVVEDHHASLMGPYSLPKVDGVVAPGVRAKIIAGGPAPGVVSGQPEAVFTGRLDLASDKGVGKLIEWWPRVVEAVPDARLTVIGGGPDLHSFREQVRGAGLESAISLPGSLPHAQLLKRIRSAGLYLLPTTFETFGIAPLEALAVGLPVVASDIPALRESLGDAALLISREDDALWIEAIRNLLSNQQERLRWAARGPLRARQFTWEKQSRAYEAHLVAAAGSGSPGSVSGPEARRNA